MAIARRGFAMAASSEHLRHGGSHSETAPAATDSNPRDVLSAAGKDPPGEYPGDASPRTRLSRTSGNAIACLFPSRCYGASIDPASCAPAGSLQTVFGRHEFAFTNAV